MKQLLSTICAWFGFVIIPVKKGGLIHTLFTTKDIVVDGNSGIKVGLQFDRKTHIATVVLNGKTIIHKNAKEVVDDICNEWRVSNASRMKAFDDIFSQLREFSQFSDAQSRIMELLNRPGGIFGDLEQCN